MIHLPSEETFKLETFLSVAEVTSDKFILNGNVFCVLYTSQKDSFAQLDILKHLVKQLHDM